MQSENRFFDDLVKLMNGVAGTVAGAGREAEGQLRERMKGMFGGMDFVSREEFDAVKVMAAAARDEADELKARLDKLQCRRMILGAAAPVGHELGECDPGVEQPGLGSAGDPRTPLNLILVDAPTFGEHPTIPVLRGDDALGRLAEPFGGTAIIPRNADPLGEADAKVERGDQVAAVGGFLEPLAGPHAVFVVASAP